MNFKLIALLLFLLMGSIATNIILTGSNKRLSSDKKKLIEFSNTDKSHIEFYKNKADKLTARVNVLELSTRDVKKISDNLRLGPVKQFDGVKDNLKNVDQITTIDAQIDTVLVLVAENDSVWRFKDKWNEATVLKSDSSRLKLKIDVPLTGAIFWQRNRFIGLRIGRKKWTFDVACDNPIVKITGLELIQIRKK